MKAIYGLILVLLPLYSYSQNIEEQWGIRYDQMAAEVCSQVKNECLVRYSAYDVDKLELPINNLKETALKGKVIVFQKRGLFWTRGKGFTSNVMENPTWLDLTLVANDIIHLSGDNHFT